MEAICHVLVQTLGLTYTARLVNSFHPHLNSKGQHRPPLTEKETENHSSNCTGRLYYSPVAKIKYHA